MTITTYAPSRVRSVLAIAVGALLSLSLAGARADVRSDAGKAMRLSDVNRGGLLLKTQTPGQYIPAPELDTRVEIDVSGPIARATVVQRFHNPSDSWVEGVYAFPLPERAAVDGLRMRIGERFIEGRIEERRRAREAYERARDAGQRAALVEQERPNIFTSSVANIGPDETVVIEIRYQESLRLESGEYRLRFPLVVGPRYIPRSRQVAGVGGVGWAGDTSRVPDASRITPPVRDPADAIPGRPLNPVAIHLRFDAGYPIAGLASAHHEIVRTIAADGRSDIRLKEQTVPSDRDFELVWRPAVDGEPLATAFQESLDGVPHLLVMVLPPTAPAAPAPDREVIYIIDTSGSMAGESIDQAMAALKQALDALRPGDRFNVIAFNSNASALYRNTRKASPVNLRHAKGFVDSLVAEGGTEMAPALMAALAAPPQPGLLRQVVFITDGNVGNEEELFALIRARLGDTRLFTVGIGSAPNSHFMRGSARAGRGSFLYIGEPEQIASRIGELVGKLQRPALTDIAVSFGDDAPARLAPAPIPDLYAGEPVVVAARLDRPVERVEISGRIAGKMWRQTVLVDAARPAPGIAKVWARNRIAGLEDAWLEGADVDQSEAEILQLALDYELVSRLTSLVAIDVTPARPAGTDTTTRAVPVDLPHGWQFDKVFGLDAAQPAPAMRKAMKATFDRQLATSGLAMRMAEAPRMAGADAASLRPVALPNTAAGPLFHLLLGLGFAGIGGIGGLAGLLALRRRCPADA